MQEETNSQYYETSVSILAQKGREEGFLTFNQIADALPSSIDPEQLGDIVQLMESIGIKVCSSPGARRSTSRSASRKGHTWSKARSLATLRQSTTS